MSKYSKRVLVSAVLIVSLMLTAYGTSAVSATDSSMSPLSPGQSAQWTVTASSGVTAAWYSDTFVPRGNFSLPVGSTIDFTITSIVGDSFRGNISVGGLVLTNISMAEISFNLLLGWYPFNPGLICPTDWSVQIQNATSNGFVVQEGLTHSEEVIIFEHLNGTVGTKLTYDMSTGILLDGYGSFGRFTVEIVLTRVSMTSPAAPVVLIISAAAMVVAVVGVWYGTSRKPRNQ